VLPDFEKMLLIAVIAIVLMHLMVLGASRPKIEYSPLATPQKVSMHLMVLGASRQEKIMSTTALTVVGLNAPDGAGCFPTVLMVRSYMLCTSVSMHLMVLGASRLDV